MVDSASRNCIWNILSPRQRSQKLVRFTREYCLKNPEFLTLVNSENLSRHAPKKRRSY
ncbi:hypothetical protein [Mesorhizobium sp. M1B.F.Ca.ET.045.04.1.1]|uniref:hypothetical protein n=1 Tax=Mesorhizobium sp. M1B.F.Ca.ET.045.04.1.1 TaxID=2493673 RepID=UPI001FE161E7|nr:hypothetical protein [Mesorhizobium sp. M1B.F.Ca.ET.045.04.1.1]